MFKELIESVTKERNNLVDKCTRNLIELAGFKLSENYSEFEIVMLIDDMRKQGYKIEYKSGMTVSIKLF